MDDYELKTVGADSDYEIGLVDPLIKEQQRHITQMRDALMSFDKDDFHSAKNAIQRITVMRIYHQVGRIIKFTEMMDRIEANLYESINNSLSQMDTMDPQTMMMLLQIQSQLQDTMIESQKLIQPYLNIDFTSIAPVQEVEPNSFGAAVLTQDARNKIRESAQAVLTALSSDSDSHNDTTKHTEDESNLKDVSEVGEDDTPTITSSVSQAAADVLASLDSETPMGDSEVPF